MTREIINQLYDANQINHAVWRNALRYLDGDYRDHRLCRLAWHVCVAVDSDNRTRSEPCPQS